MMAASLTGLAQPVDQDRLEALGKRLVAGEIPGVHAVLTQQDGKRLAEWYLECADVGNGGQRIWITLRFEGADHSPRTWRERLHIPLKFLLGKPSRNVSNGMLDKPVPPPRKRGRDAASIAKEPGRPGSLGRTLISPSPSETGILPNFAKQTSLEP
jgi:hypothetical protein